MTTTAIIIWLAFNVAFVVVRLMANTAPKVAQTPAKPESRLRLVS